VTACTRVPNTPRVPAPATASHSGPGSTNMAAPPQAASAHHQSTARRPLARQAQAKTAPARAAPAAQVAPNTPTTT